MSWHSMSLGVGVKTNGVGHFLFIFIRKRLKIRTIIISWSAYIDQVDNETEKKSELILTEVVKR